MSYKVKRYRLSFWHRIYVPEIMRGVWITTWHFIRNLFFHVLHLVGIAKKTRAAVTYQYPEERRPLAYRLRSRHRLAQKDSGKPRCVACMLCESICPAKCIKITAGEDPDPNVEKRPISFEIDLGKCVYCGFCVEVCPEDAIRMDTQLLDISAYSRQAMVLDMPELLNPASRKEAVPLERPHDPFADSV